ncbi:MAG: segregation/condensation protein A [Bacillota bacterium]|nr:segregation/condensation protein A [Bacillota bacterium]
MQFQLEQFEGPLDLLLSLIQQKQVDIDALSLLSITEQYLHAVENLRFDMDEVAEFVAIASILVEMKAKYLNKGILETVESEEDPMNALVLRLREYQKYKQISTFFSDRFGALDAHFFRERPDLEMKTEEVDELRLDASLLLEAFQRIVDNLQRFDDERQTYFETIRRDRYTVADRMRSIRRILGMRDRLVFSELFDEETTKSEMIVTFLAILELLKAGTIRVQQESVFGEILIRSGVKREGSN